MSKLARLSSGRYTIGITVWVQPDGSFAFFTNGLRQNVIFLYKLFSASPRCRKVYLINHGPGEPGDVPDGLGIDRTAIVRSEKVANKLDYLVVLGAAADMGSLAALREKGCKIINYKAGNGAVIAMEAVVSGAPDKDGERYADYAMFDAVWMTPQHAHTYKSWCETVYRCPVHVVPHIWDDTFFRIQPPFVHEGYGYKPGERQWRIGIMDPNITVMKTSHLPALVCEGAYRQCPDKFRAIYITNAIQFQTNNHFSSFVGALSACKAGVMTVEPRFVSWEFITNHADAVVTHHWENGLNYLFYEVLYGNYPLIHNSEFLKGWGYYYEDFNAEDGARALLEAVSTHDRRFEQYKDNNASLFERINPTAKDNIYVHEKLLLATETRAELAGAA